MSDHVQGLNERRHDQNYAQASAQQNYAQASAQQNYAQASARQMLGGGALRPRRVRINVMELDSGFTVSVDSALLSGNMSVALTAFDALHQVACALGIGEAVRDPRQCPVSENMCADEGHATDPYADEVRDTRRVQALAQAVAYGYGRPEIGPAEIPSIAAMFEKFIETGK